jgi:hypothetical protein
MLKMVVGIVNRMWLTISAVTFCSIMDRFIGIYDYISIFVHERNSIHKVCYMRTGEYQAKTYLS